MWLNNIASDSEKAGIKTHCHRCHPGIMGLSLQTVLALCSGDKTTSRIPHVKWHLGEWQEFLFWARGGTVTEKSVPSRSGAEGSQAEAFQIGNSSVGRFGSLVCSQTLGPWRCRLRTALCWIHCHVQNKLPFSCLSMNSLSQNSPPIPILTTILTIEYRSLCISGQCSTIGYIHAQSTFDCKSYQAYWLLSIN